jgi:DNA-binding NtrC family response regulator
MSDRESAHTTEISDGSDVVVLRRRRLRLDVKKGLDRKLRGDFDTDRIVIGTHPSCDMTLRDPTVSRQHCEIALVDRGYQLSDLDSTNGTFVDKLRVGQVVTTGPLTFRVGETTITMSPTGETVDIELPEETSFGPLLGRSAKMRQVFELLGKVAPTDATVLITGESGTGKELAARAIHDASPRAAGPFVVVDCGAMPANLIESELYGHQRGAFTGADRARVGAFEAASKGTLFLDELGELPLDLQPRLLGAIERRAIQPLGTSEMRPVDVRVVAATNRDLRREVNRGSFREDLYFRLAVVAVEMPPLRDRPEDIPLYVRDFLAEEAMVRPSFTIDNPTMARLAVQPWRGNVRELRNVLERAAALGSVDLPEAMPGASSGDGGAVDVNVPFKVGKAALIERYEREYVSRLIDAHDKNITRAARSAEIDRVYLLRLLDKYGLRPGR